MKKILRTVSRVVHHELASYVPMVVTMLYDSNHGELAHGVLVLVRAALPSPPKQ